MPSLSRLMERCEPVRSLREVVSGALYHYFVRRDQVMQRMLAVR